MVSKRIICIDLGSSIFSNKNSDASYLNSIVTQYEKLCNLGYKIIAFAGPGWIGCEYFGIARSFTKNNEALLEISKRASGVNSLLLIEVILKGGLRTKSTPFYSIEELEEFARASRNWQVLVAVEHTEKIVNNFAKKIGASVVKVYSGQEKPRSTIVKFATYENILRVARERR